MPTFVDCTSKNVSDSALPQSRQILGRKVKLVEINDLIYFEDWILAQPTQSGELLGSRLVMRLLPFWRDFHSDKSHVNPERTLPFWRVSFADWVYFVTPNENRAVAERRQEARSAYVRAFPTTAYGKYISAKGQERKAAQLTNVCKSLIRSTRNAVDIDDVEQVVWNAISRDASIIEKTRGFEFCASRPLWPNHVPEWAEAQWSNFTSDFMSPELHDDKKHWRVWTDWYEERLWGKKYDLELENRKVNLPDAAWNRQADEINLGLLRTIEIRSEEVEAAKDQLTLFSLLDTKEIRAALADFEFNELKSIMEMVPFQDDHGGELGEVDKKNRTAALQDLFDSINDLTNDIIEEGKNVPRSVLNTLKRYADECLNDFDDIRPGRLWDLGALLHNARLDEDFEFSMGSLLFKSFEQTLDKHFDLMRDYFAATIARQRNVDDIEQVDGALPENLLEALEEAGEALKHSDWGALPAPSDEVPGVIGDQVDELKDLFDAAQYSQSEKTRQRLLATFWRKGKTAAVTLLRYAARTGSAVGMAVGTAAALQQLFPAQFGLVLQKVLALFSNIPWLL